MCGLKLFYETGQGHTENSFTIKGSDCVHVNFYTLQKDLYQ